MSLFCCVSDVQFLLHMKGIKSLLVAKIRHNVFFLSESRYKDQNLCNYYGSGFFYLLFPSSSVFEFPFVIAGVSSLCSAHMYPSQQETFFKACCNFWICYIGQTKKGWLVYALYSIKLYKFKWHSKFHFKLSHRELVSHGLSLYIFTSPVQKLLLF